MKNIWIDGYEANQPQRLGSGQVAFELIKNIEKIDHKNEYTILLPNPPLKDLPKQRSGFKYKILKPKFFWTKIAIPFNFFGSKIKPDVIFSPTHYIPSFVNCKRVVTIFDLSFLFFPQMFNKRDLWQLKNWTRYSILNSDSVITISNSTKKDILKNYQVPSDKVTVTYPGFNSQFFKPIKDQAKIEEVLKKYSIDQSYIIYIGTVQPRKNLIRLIEAFRKIEGLKLVIVGKITGLGRKAWMFDQILNKPKELGISDKVIFTDFVPTEELPLLISGAVAYILPSLYEGFGIPVVEAMACGTAVIVSNNSSLPEVVEDAGLLIDPKKIDHIEQSIRTISTDVKLRNKLSKLSLEQAKKFSWEKMAKVAIKVLENV